MKFVQIMEFKTTNLDAALELEARWRKATEGKRTATSVVKTLDRDKPETYVWIIEFPSYEDAMRNSDLPATQEISQELTKISEGPPMFRNLDIMEETPL
ncbi:MAG TPA: hypothetical protein VGU73_08400 [Acidimicrobiia bacterium]|nr:hypothetical protein [Acidimicrobiia bacterium]